MALPNMTARPATLQELQAQLAALQARPPGGTVGGGSFGQRQSQAAQEQWVRQQMALNQQIQALSNAGAGGTGGAGAGGAGGTDIDAMILAALQERAGKDAGPFDETTQNALMTSAAQQAAQQALNARGRISGSAGDPSVQAAINESEARRLAAVQGARLGIQTQANVANYDARGQALGQWGDYYQNLQRRQMQQNAMNQAQAGIPSFSEFRGATQPRAQQPQSNWQFTQPTTAPARTSGVSPATPDMSGWTPAQRAAYTGQQVQQPPAQRVVAPTRQPVQGPAYYDRPPVNEPYRPQDFIPAAWRKG